ncbi:hypothetical protein PR048_030522 [Dryococelus australis]|uniref:Uncharacterized protein n=1 Tax=Dryococelus australis TaxID=614101 RepID=A0ABQ9GD32_9NEOP|nr:hypothetical protein PR048_030522 [Dryococelus australis]
MEQRRNERVEETGDPRENPPINGIVRHDSLLANIRSEPPGNSNTSCFGDFHLALSSHGVNFPPVRGHSFTAPEKTLHVHNISIVGQSSGKPSACGFLQTSGNALPLDGKAGRSVNQIEQLPPLGWGWPRQLACQELNCTILVSDDATGRRVFARMSCFPRPSLPTLLHTHITSPSSALQTSMSRGAPLNAEICEMARNEFDDETYLAYVVESNLSAILSFHFLIVGLVIVMVVGGPAAHLLPVLESLLLERGRGERLLLLEPAAGLLLAERRRRLLPEGLAPGLAPPGSPPANHLLCFGSDGSAVLTCQQALLTKLRQGVVNGEFRGHTTALVKKLLFRRRNLVIASRKWNINVTETNSKHIPIAGALRKMNDVPTDILRKVHHSLISNSQLQHLNGILRAASAPKPIMQNTAVGEGRPNHVEHLDTMCVSSLWTGYDRKRRASGSNEEYGVRDPVETQEDLLARVMVAVQQIDGTPGVKERVYCNMSRRYNVYNDKWNEDLIAPKQTPPGRPTVPDITAGDPANKAFVVVTLHQQDVQRRGRAVHRQIWAALNVEVLRADEGEAWSGGSGVGMKGRRKREIPEKTRRPAASSATIRACENLGATPPEIKPGSPRSIEGIALTIASPGTRRPDLLVVHVADCTLGWLPGSLHTSRPTSRARFRNVFLLVPAVHRGRSSPSLTVMRTRKIVKEEEEEIEEDEEMGKDKNMRWIRRRRGGVGEGETEKEDDKRRGRRKRR